jgi:hypothetical protein
LQPRVPVPTAVLAKQQSVQHDGGLAPSDNNAHYDRNYLSTVYIKISSKHRD